jgi:alpha-tubulin suppressor-like RCC1 family protein
VRQVRLAVVVVWLALATVMVAQGSAGASGPASVSLGSVRVVDGSAPRAVRVPITLSQAQGSDVFVTWNVIGGTATSGSDFKALPAEGKITKIKAGKTRGFATVKLLATTGGEADETIQLSITAVSGAPVAVGVGTGQVNIASPGAPTNGTIWVGDVTAVEGDEPAPAPHVVSVPLTYFDTAPSSTDPPVQVTYQLVAVSATPGADFKALSAPKTIKINTAKGGGRANVVLYADTIPEPDETIQVQILSVVDPNNPTSIADPTTVDDDYGQVTIADDDTTPPPAGTLWTWGTNNYGQLGLGSLSYGPNPLPQQVGTATNWSAIAAGTFYTVGIRSDGTLWAWGYNGFGQLGLGNTVTKSTPQQVGTATDWMVVTAGGYHTLAIKSDGTLWAWGLGTSGQLGLGDTNSYTTPQQVGTATDWVAVSAGLSHTLAIKSDGTLWAWGKNDLGQLGLGDTTNRNTPTQVGTATNWAAVTAGDYHTVAVRSSGTLWAWGFNNAGQLGLGNTTDQNTPQQVVTGTNWVAATAGTMFTVALRADGTLWAWGVNYYGQLGLGDTTNRSVPNQVGSATDWSAVDAGEGHTLAIRSDGTLWAWGHNSDGELGLGHTTSYTAPVQVGSATDWMAVAAGAGAHTVGIRQV